ncbi:MAG: hypothetical protein K0S23_1251 [Fluviicola sp.]|nr:hypothetical protein [Fluviicola sp.]
MNLIKRLFLLVILLAFAFKSRAQLRPSAAILLNSVNQTTCYGSMGDANINLLLINPPASTVIGGYTLVLNKDGAYYSTFTSSVIQGSTSLILPISNLPVGSYTLSGTINGYNTSTMAVNIHSVATLSFFIGYQAIWSETKEMAIQTLSSTVLQNVTTPTSTYAGARASNTDIGDCWVLATPFFNSGNATNRSVYVSLVNTAALVSFNPLTQNGYLEFRKAGSDPATGDGVYYKSTSGTFKLTGVTYTDKIRVVKFGSNLLFYKDHTVTALASGATSPYIASLSTQLVLTPFTTVINDGVNIATSLKCNSSGDVYATLFHELDGYYYTMKNGKLRFVFNQNYDTQNNMKFNIYDQKGLLMKTQTSFPAVQVIYGENYLTLDLTTTNGCIGQGFFILEVISDKKEKMVLRFYNEYNSCTPEGEGAPGGIGG